MPTTIAEADALYAQIQTRLVESGEWDRIRAVLASKLNEQGWLDDLKHRSKERATGADNMRFDDLFQEFAPNNVLGSVPLAIKREVTHLLRSYVEKQIM